jgi:hypothetical protein
MTLSHLSLAKENISPFPSPSLLPIPPVKEILSQNRKRKRSDWFRTPLEDITHLFHPNNNEVAPPLHLGAPMERRCAVVVKRRILNPVQNLQMRCRVSLRKEFR